MISYTQQRTQYGDLSQNTSSTNLTRGSFHANVEQRYLLQKYFNNEGTFRFRTVGATTLNLTGQIQVGATSGTLAVAWPYHTTTESVTFADSEARYVTLTNNSTSITWQTPIQGASMTVTTSIASGDTSATLSTAWAYPSGTYTIAFSDGETQSGTFTLNSTAITFGAVSQAVTATIYVSYIGSTGNLALTLSGVQYYKTPPNFSKLKTVTITVGVLQWNLSEVMSRTEWDSLNVFPYFASIPDRFFVYDDNTIGIWPIPSATGNTITTNYQFRVPDLSIADYATGTITATNGSLTITGSSTTWTVTTNKQNESRWIQIPQTSGDNLWYQVASVDSTTSISLYEPYQGVTVAGASYTLGQMPLLHEDFQDMLIWKPLIVYFTSIVKNPTQAKMYEEMYAQKLKQLNDYLGNKVTNVNLSRKGRQKNPNLFGQTFG